MSRICSLVSVLPVAALAFASPSQARAQIDCAQCQAVCKDQRATSNYPDELGPDELPARVTHKHEDAQRAFLDAQRRDPGFGGSDLEGALRSYRRAVKIDPDNAQYRNYLAAALMTAGLYDEAAYNLQAAVRLVPSEPKYLVNLGYAFHKQGDEPRALVHYMRALMLDPRDVRARLFAGYAMEVLGMVEDAALEMQRVLAQDPQHQGAKRALQRLRPGIPPHTR